MENKLDSLLKKLRDLKIKIINSNVQERAAAIGISIAMITGATAYAKSLSQEKINTIQRNVQASGFLSDNYGDIEGNLDLSRIERDVFKEHDFTFICVADDQIPHTELQKAMEQSKDIGLIIKPTNYTYASIYKTIDVVKKIVSNYDINCPILYDISTMMDDDTIRANCLLAEEFCNKLTANGCYVGLYGTEEDIAKFSNKFEEVTETHSIDLYDKMIVSELTSSDKLSDINDDNSYNMLQLKNGVVLWKYDLARVIDKNNLNQEQNFTDEFVYTIESGDCLSDIASAYNMKVTDLTEYNGLNSTTIYPGNEIVIPNNYTHHAIQGNENVELNENKFDSEEEQNPAEMDSETLNRIVKGIDVSEYQGEINWDVANEDIDFAILRLCDFYNKTADDNCELDEQFIRNMTACEEKNIPVGVYYFSRATTPEEAAAEAEFVAEKLRNYSLEYPVYMDVETDELNDMMQNNPQAFEKLVEAAMGSLKDNGFCPGIYANKTFAQNVLYLSDKYPFWLTSNETYDTSVQFDTFKESDYKVVFIPDNKTSMYQYTQKGQVDGIFGEVDIDYAAQSLSDSITAKVFNR